jgi:hypothetical protein
MCSRTGCADARAREEGESLPLRKLRFGIAFVKPRVFMFEKGTLT